MSSFLLLLVPIVGLSGVVDTLALIFIAGLSPLCCFPTNFLFTIVLGLPLFSVVLISSAVLTCSVSGSRLAGNTMLKGTGCRLPVSGWLEPVSDLLKQKKYRVS